MRYDSTQVTLNRYSEHLQTACFVRVVSILVHETFFFYFNAINHFHKSIAVFTNHSHVLGLAKLYRV